MKLIIEYGEEGFECYRFCECLRFVHLSTYTQVVSLLSSRSLTQLINYFRRGPDLVTEQVNTNKLLNTLDALLNYKDEITSHFCIIHRQNVLLSY